MALTNRFFTFLSELELHNRRDWFEAHRADYEADVEAPLLALLAEIAPGLAEVAPRIRCVPARHRGSLMRIQRDTRFSADKTPYKTHMGAMMLHGTQTRGPGMLGYLLRVGLDGCYLGAGVAAPATPELAKLRQAIGRGGARWRAVRDGLEGDQRVRVPAPFPADHEFEGDLRRTSFLRTVPFTRKQVTGKAFGGTVVAAAGELAPFLRFLSRGLGLPW